MQVAYTFAGTACVYVSAICQKEHHHINPAFHCCSVQCCLTLHAASSCVHICIRHPWRGHWTHTTAPLVYSMDITVHTVATRTYDRCYNRLLDAYRAYMHKLPPLAKMSAAGPTQRYLTFCNDANVLTHIQVLCVHISP